jgi:hypothetical protein
VDIGNNFGTCGILQKDRKYFVTSLEEFYVSILLGVAILGGQYKSTIATHYLILSP